MYQISTFKIMSNSVVQHIANFLKEYQPFNYLSFEDLLSISNTVRVINLESDKILFQIDDVLHDSFYVVASGTINLSVFSDAEETLLNRCNPGDIFGLRPFFAKNNYKMTAKAREECIIYAIPIVTFKPFVAKNIDVLNFLLESFASNHKNTQNKDGSVNEAIDSIHFSENQSDMLYFQTLTYNKSPLIVKSNSAINEVAQLMTNNMLNNAVVVNGGYPIGIVTDSDFRSKIATGKLSITEPIDKIMAAPVITVNQNISVAEAQLIMLKHNVTHLCVTQEGTNKSEVKGVISEHDLVVAQANNPGILIKEINRADNAKSLKFVRDKLTEIIYSSMVKSIPLAHIHTIASEINLAISKRAVELAILDMGSPPTAFAWLCIGSQGRKEQLLLTNQSNMLVFEDVPANRYRDVKNYYLKLAKKATTTLEKVGYPLSSEGYVASNMLWCKSISDWKKQYSNWITTPGENIKDISTIFFDFEIAFGEQKVEDILVELIYKKAKNNMLFFDYLGNDALRKPPPFTFFKKFNVEEEGENKGKFDIKSRALEPLIDGARLLCLSMGIKGVNNTYLRYKQLALVDSKYSEVYLNCAKAFIKLSKIRTLDGLRNDTNGQFINLQKLNKLDKEKLKLALASIRELEEIIKDKFQLTQFS